MAKKAKCGGWRRHGSFMSFGVPEWVRCKEEPTVMLTIKQGKEPIVTMPSCPTCWTECIEHRDIKVIKAEPM